MQVTVGLHGVLRQHADGRNRLDVDVADGATVAAVMDRLAAEFPAVERRIRDETGNLRRHVNVFVDGEDVRRMGGLGHALGGGEEIVVLPAISGG